MDINIENGGQRVSIGTTNLVYITHFSLSQRETMYTSANMLIFITIIHFV